MKAKSKHAEIAEILKTLEAEVYKIFTSEYYLEVYLKTFSKFHNYSFNNALWIYLQRQDATIVASFNDWKKKFNRNVKKGAKGIKILVPIKKKIVKEGTVTADDGSVTTEEMVFQKLYFNVGYVFDISDTEGQPLPEIVTLLQYNSDFLKNLIAVIIKSSEVPIIILKESDQFGNANGYYSITSNEIYVKQNLSDLQKLKTMLHELSHYIQETKFAANIKDIGRSSKEVIAESTAYCVMTLLNSHYHIDELKSDAYSFGYIVSWSKDKTLVELKSTLSLISTISNQLFNWITSLAA